MQRLVSAKPVLAAVVAFGALAAASAAHARTDVALSIGVPINYGYVQPQPVYVQPRTVYVEPQPVYVQPRTVYVQPQPVYVQPQPVYVQRGSYYDGGYHHRHGHRNGPWGDADRDGVPNRFDRAPLDPYRR